MLRPCGGVSRAHSLDPRRTRTQLYDWTFNVFELAERSGGRPLYVVTMALLEDQGLLVSESERRGTCCCCCCSRGRRRWAARG